MSSTESQAQLRWDAEFYMVDSNVFDGRKLIRNWVFDQHICSYVDFELAPWFSSLCGCCSGSLNNSFLYSVLLINKEYFWFIEYRHKFMSQQIPWNCAIYVSGIPEHLRSDYALTDFFCYSSWNSAVAEAHMAMDTPSLEADVARQNVVIEKLEHTLAKGKIKWIVATHRMFHLENATKMGTVTKKVDSVEAYEQELRQLNNDISLGIGKVNNQNHRLRHHLKKSPPRDSKTDSKTLRLELLQTDLPLSPMGFELLQEHIFRALPLQGDSGLSPPIVELNSPRSKNEDRLQLNN
jgi:hypothetical protein